MHKNGKDKFGDLVVFSSKDNFTKYKIVIKSHENEVIYASRPYLDNKSIYITYSILSYDKDYYYDWRAIQYNYENNKIIEDYNLSNFTQGFVGNRPTSIVKINNKLLIGTSMFKEDEYIKKERFFNRKNNVKLLEIDLTTKSKKIVHSNDVISPYYSTDIFIDKNGNWIYFDKSKAISNVKLNEQCFNHMYMMYPNIYQKNIFYITPNN